MIEDALNPLAPPTAAWFPDESAIQSAHIYQLMKKKGFKHYEELQQWAAMHYVEFWKMMVKILNIRFDKPYTKVVDLVKGIENPQWFPHAQLNIIQSCFQANKDNIAIFSSAEFRSPSESNADIHIPIVKTTYEELDKLSNRVANSISAYLKKGDKVAIVLPLTPTAVAIYLGVIKAGCVCVSIAESFATEEIKMRLRIAEVNLIFTQDYIPRQEKVLPLYQKIKDANAPVTVVLQVKNIDSALRSDDIVWENFLSENDHFNPLLGNPDDPINILFSSGTTGEPKAIPWTQTTPIKCASDAYLHHNLQPQDVFCWPTSLEWMMGPWLIFATLLNKATLALFDGLPNGKKFGEFVQNAKVTHLGVVPTLVRTWRNSHCMEDLDWSAIKLFSSTGESSNPEDMLYLMSLANRKNDYAYRPIIEYCGGTEIGGAYVTSTVIQPNAPSAFTTPALGLDFVILDDEGKTLPNNSHVIGEVAIILPSIGLSCKILNQDHHKVYYEHMPKLPDGRILRRHGDQIERFENGFYRLRGRVDDTMKISGIKVSAAEIELILNNLPDILETAAVAIEPIEGGPNQLIIFVVLKTGEDINESPKRKIMLKKMMQNQIKMHLNPQFKIQEVIFLKSLPRTASNKIIRRTLRDAYRNTHL